MSWASENISKCFLPLHWSVEFSVQLVIDLWYTRKKNLNKKRVSFFDNILKMKVRIEKKVQWAGGFYFSNPANSCSDAGKGLTRPPRKSLFFFLSKLKQNLLDRPFVIICFLSF